MRNYITVLLFAVLSFCSVYSISAQDTGEVVVSGDENGGRSTSENIRVFKNAQSIDVYIFGYAGSVSISVENEAGQTVTSASTVSLEDGRMSLPLPALPAGSYRVVIVAGDTYTGSFLVQ